MLANSWLVGRALLSGMLGLISLSSTSSSSAPLLSLRSQAAFRPTCAQHRAPAAFAMAAETAEDAETAASVAETAASVAETPAVAAVRTWLAQRSDVTMLPPEALAPDVRFEGDLGTVRGKENYIAAAARWHADSVELLQYETTLLKVASISEDEVVVRWRAEWDPPTLQWAPALAAALRWRIERFDVEPGVVSTFRWSSVFRLFAGAFATGVLRCGPTRLGGCNPTR
jgi:hypothetical protein